MLLRAFVACALVCGIAGCSLPTSVSATGDVGPGAPDTGGGGMDSGPPVDAWSNVDMGPRPDAWAPDMYVPGVDAYVPPVDAYVPPVDAYVPPVDAYVAPDMFVPPVDAYVPPVDAYTPPTCAASYPTVANFCVDDGTYCGFLVNLTGGSTCTSVCGASGCVHGYRPGPSGMRCTVGSDDGCGTSASWHVCVCNR